MVAYNRLLAPHAASCFGLSIASNLRLCHDLSCLRKQAMHLRIMLTAMAICWPPLQARSEALKYPAFYTGVRLFESCKAETPDCTAYVMAVADMISVLETEGLSPSTGIPSGISARPIILSIQAFVSKNA